MVEPNDEQAVEHFADAGLALPVATGVAVVRTAPVIGRLSIRCASDVAERIGADIGLDLGAAINRATMATGTAALRLGPDEWLVLAEAHADPWLGARIGATAGGAPIAIIDVTHRTAGLVIEGPSVEDVLANGCPLPLDVAAFPTGRATRTLLAKAEVVLWRRAPDTFHIEVARSLLPYTVGWLGEVIRCEQAITAARG